MKSTILLANPLLGIRRRSSLFNTDRIDHLYQDPHLQGTRMFLHYGDLTDTSSLVRIIQQVQPDEVYNLAAQSHVAVSFEEGSIGLLKRQSFGFRQHFGEFLPTDKSARIADLGCGSGGLVWWLTQTGYLSTKGIDGSPEQVELAHQLGIENVALGDVFEFLDNENGHAALFARDLIEHFDKQSVFDFLGKCFSSLAPGGQLVLQVPNGESPYFGRVRYGDFTHELAFSASSISQLLGAVGFTKIEIHPWRPIITGPKSLIRYISWRLIEPFLKLPIQIESGGRNRIVTMNLIAVARKPD